jgi:16S rRNA (uracil1498-N3)-methyltransferase
MAHSTAHLFALWHAPQLPAKQTELVINDDLLVNRISAILRLRIGEQLLLFNRQMHALVTIMNIGKKAITVRCEAVHKNKIYSPTITALLPLLKKDDLATAVVQLVACGISAIQLIITENTQRSWGGDAEYERLERLIIASAEQAKQFAMPLLHKPILLQDAIVHHKTLIVGDPLGVPFKHIMQKLPDTLRECALLVGPEADFTIQEKKLLEASGALHCSLTPTVLRSQLAVTLLAGTVRSWYYVRD